MLASGIEDLYGALESIGLLAKWSVRDQTVCDSMTHVVKITDPLKVTHVVVGLDAILVIDLGKVEGIGDEVLGDESMQQMSRFLVSDRGSDT